MQHLKVLRDTRIAEKRGLVGSEGVCAPGTSEMKIVRLGREGGRQRVLDSRSIENKRIKLNN